MPLCEDNCLNYIQQSIPSNKRKSEFAELFYGSQMNSHDNQFPNPKKACISNDLDTNILGNPHNNDTSSLGRPNGNHVSDNQIQSQASDMEISNPNPKITSSLDHHNQTETFRNSNMVRCHCFPSWDGFGGRMPYQADYY